jgi:hypothetical protein
MSFGLSSLSKVLARPFFSHPGTGVLISRLMLLSQTNAPPEHFSGDLNNVRQAQEQVVKYVDSQSGPLNNPTWCSVVYCESLYLHLAYSLEFTTHLISSEQG